MTVFRKFSIYVAGWQVFDETKNKRINFFNILEDKHMLVEGFKTCDRVKDML
jgi:hypothetical protein